MNTELIILALFCFAIFVITTFEIMQNSPLKTTQQNGMVWDVGIQKMFGVEQKPMGNNPNAKPYR